MFIVSQTHSSVLVFKHIEIIPLRHIKNEKRPYKHDHLLYLYTNEQSKNLTTMNSDYENIGNLSKFHIYNTS